MSEVQREGREYSKAAGGRLCDIRKICSRDVRKRRSVNREGAGGKRACDRVDEFEIEVCTKDWERVVECIDYRQED